MGPDTDGKMDTPANTTPTEHDGCGTSDAARYLTITWVTVYLLFLPVFLLVLYIGFNKWKKPQPSASGGLSHSDVFTLHMVAMEMINIIGSCILLCSFFTVTENGTSAALDLLTLAVTGQVLFHSLTCVERYLAVVHPVTYLRLRREGGATIRNTSIALVWVSSVSIAVITGLANASRIYGLVLMVLFTPLVTYCSVTALCVLVRPKPGAGDRKLIDQSKQTTVYTMVAILGVLLMKLIGAVIFYSFGLTMEHEFDVCVVGTALNWLYLPSSLVLPLLFLHRAGKLLCKR